jgi:hypothetical protein
MTDIELSTPRGDLKDGYSQEEVDAERAQIFKAFRSMKFGEQARQTVIACMKKCSPDPIKYPFRSETIGLRGKPEICFGDCLNVNFEQGPYLKTLGEVPEDSIPKKFIWAHSL